MLFLCQLNYSQVDGVFRMRSLGTATPGITDQYSDGKAAKVWQLYIGLYSSLFPTLLSQDFEIGRKKFNLINDCHYFELFEVIYRIFMKY